MPRKKYEILANDKTVWINSMSGECLARFDKRFGIDIHHSVDNQQKNGLQCLFCVHGKMNEPDWKIFIIEVKKNYGITIDKKILQFNNSLRINAMEDPFKLIEKEYMQAAYKHFKKNQKEFLDLVSEIDSISLGEEDLYRPDVSFWLGQYMGCISHISPTIRKLKKSFDDLFTHKALDISESS